MRSRSQGTILVQALLHRPHHAASPARTASSDVLQTACSSSFTSGLVAIFNSPAYPDTACTAAPSAAGKGHAEPSPPIPVLFCHGRDPFHATNETLCTGPYPHAKAAHAWSTQCRMQGIGYLATLGAADGALSRRPQAHSLRPAPSRSADPVPARALAVSPRAAPSFLRR